MLYFLLLRVFMVFSTLFLDRQLREAFSFHFSLDSLQICRSMRLWTGFFFLVLVPVSMLSDKVRTWDSISGSVGQRNKGEFAWTKKGVLSSSLTIYRLKCWWYLSGLHRLLCKIPCQRSGDKDGKVPKAHYPLIPSLISPLKFIFCCSSQISKVFFFLLILCIFMIQYSMGTGIKNSFSFLKNTLMFTEMHFFVSKLILKKIHYFILKKNIDNSDFFPISRYFVFFHWKQNHP